jgi:phosphoglucosamine mutase
VDELGNIVDGDKIMFIIGNYMKSQGRLKRDTIVTTVMSNLGLYKAIEANGMKSVQTAVGDRHVVEEMRKDGYNIGGEQSGHVILFDHHNTGDGMLTGIQLLSVMAATGKKLSELAAPVQTYPQKLVNVPITDKEAWKNYPAITDAIAKIEAKMAGNGRVLVRLSGTEALLRVTAEAKTEELVNGYVEEIVAVVEEEMGL